MKISSQTCSVFNLLIVNLKFPPVFCQTCSPQQQTEWQRYLRQSLEVVAKVMELLPSHAFTTLVSHHPCLTIEIRGQLSLTR